MAVRRRRRSADPSRTSRASRPSRIPAALARQLERMGIAPLWQQTRGAGVKIAVLDSALAPCPGLAAPRVIALNPDGGPALPSAVPHGTHCASLIASDRAGAQGVAPEAEVIGIAVALAGGAPRPLRVRKAIALALARDCDVISCSFTLPDPDAALEALVRDAHLRGVPVVAAAGNDPQRDNCFPERTPHAIVVGALTPSGAAMPCRINRWTDLFALGAELDVTTVEGRIALWPGQTSGATALVSGVIALALAPLTPVQRRRVGPALEGLLKASAVALPAPAGSELPALSRVDPAAFFSAVQQLAAQSP